MRAAERRLARVTAGGVLAAALVGGVVACSESPDPEPTPSPSPSEVAEIAVAGDFGVRPSITVPEGTTVTEMASAVLIEGDGVVAGPGELVLLNYVAVDAVTGEVVADTYAGPPELRPNTPEDLGQPVYDLIAGAGAGTRAMLVELGTKSNPHAHVIVVDVVPQAAVGEELPTAAGLPAVTRDAEGQPTVVVPEAAGPHQTVIAALVKGSGPQVRLDQSVILQVLAVRWADGAVVDSTWDTSPRTVAVQDLPRGLAGGVVEQTVGSQVLVVVPPEEGNGVDTLIYVVDILATADVTLPPEG